jgi:very-short-patch-repair endonuclease
LLGRYITDFYAPAAHLAVEVDGGYHARRERADARRDAKLTRAGYRVLRLEAELVMRDLPAALGRIRGALAGR